MTSLRPRARPEEADGEDPISRLQATLEREEHRRVSIRRAGLIAVVLFAAVAAAAVALLQGNASAAGRSPVSAATQQPAAVVPVTPNPAHEVTSQTMPVQPAQPAVRSLEKKPPAKRQAAKPAASKPSEQEFSIAIGSTGYEPGVVRATTGRPIVLAVGRGEGCASGFLIPKLGVNEDNSRGPITVKLGALPAGTYRFSCGMDMVTGKLIVE